MTENYTKITRKDEAGLEQNLLVNTSTSTVEETIGLVKDWARDLELRVSNFIEGMAKLGYQTFSYGDAFTHRNESVLVYDESEPENDRGLTRLVNLVGHNFLSVTYDNKECGILSQNGSKMIFLPVDSQLKNIAHAIIRMQGIIIVLGVDLRQMLREYHPDISWTNAIDKCVKERGYGNYDDFFKDQIRDGYPTQYEKYFPEMKKSFPDPRETLVKDVKNFSDYLQELRNGFRYIVDYLDGVRKNEEEL